MNTVNEWPKRIYIISQTDPDGQVIAIGEYHTLHNQDDYNNLIDDSIAWRYLTEEEVQAKDTEEKIVNLSYKTTPALANWIIECKNRIDQVTLATENITSVISATSGVIDVDAFNVLMESRTEQLSEYAVCAKLFIAIFRMIDEGTVASMQPLRQLDADQIYEALRTIWNNVSLKNLDALENHGYDRELYERLHEHTTNPTKFKLR